MASGVSRVSPGVPATPMKSASMKCEVCSVRYGDEANIAVHTDRAMPHAESV